MKLRSAERRRSERVPASNPVTLREPSGQIIAHCRASNVSETGMLVVVRQGEQPLVGEEVVAEMARADGTCRDPVNVYRCRVVRIIRGGNLVGLGLQFLPSAD